MKTLFPEIRPYRTELLSVGEGHELYIECSGTETGIPVLVLHGGPGAGASEQMRRFFDPERYHIILFDQRGAGRSIPHASTEFNTVQHTIADMERIRNHLGITRWVLFGGSFGATLALLYAEQYPQQVCGLLLRGVFLSRQQDLNWLYKEGAGRYFPDEWHHFIKEVEGKTGEDLIEAYYQRLDGKNELARISAAKAWARWEVEISTLRPSQTSADYFLATHTAIALAKISSHYFRNHSFIEENQILENAGKLNGIPGYIIHGRYDMICPPDQAFALSEQWQDGELLLVREGGHSAFDEAMIDALVGSTCRMAKRLGSPESEA
ncbi:prolyl aminopeptidase [Reinekea marinisedimentorum]|uniref:Proline iminopeptidase n=1 Tax=Reinekea marinisedimentorum TaxID=230495 RepID=A0A4R3IE22_9GAMM|nr:prolyl aminopeptidase [Reinekea marinisedimentorum]TCS43838.1 proline iminopeptidase [Reinekea marinisedimentorum]